MAHADAAANGCSNAGAAVEAASGSAADPVDVMAELERCMQDTKLLERVLDKFGEHVPAAAKELGSAGAGGNAAEVARGSRMESSEPRPMRRRMEVRIWLRSLEEMGRTARLEEAVSRMAALEAEMTRCVAYIPQALEKARRVPAADPISLQLLTRR